MADYNWVTIASGLYYHSDKNMLIRHQYIKSISEFNTEIIRRGKELKSL